MDRGLVSDGDSQVATAPAQTAVGTTEGQIVPANATRGQVIIQNTGTTVIKIALGAAATQTAYHVSLQAASAADDGSGGVFISDFWKGAIRAISSAAGGTCVVTEINR